MSYPTLGSQLKRICRFALLISVAVLFLVDVSMADNLPPRAYEKRTYAATQGNLNKLHGLFRQHSGRYFVKHGIQVIATLVPTKESAAGNTVIWIFAHANEESAHAAWSSFNQDPKWLKLLAEASPNEALIERVESEFFRPADYSPMQ